MNIPDIELGRRKILKDCDIQRHRICAIAFTPNGRIICVETNRLGCGDVSDFSWHAEEFLIRKLMRIKARERFGKINILVARLGRQKGWTMARPCDGCARKLMRYVDRVYYVDENGKIQLYE